MIYPQGGVLNPSPVPPNFLVYNSSYIAHLCVLEFSMPFRIMLNHREVETQCRCSPSLNTNVILR